MPSDLRAWAVVCAVDAADTKLCDTKAQAETYAKDADEICSCGPHTVVELGPVEPEVVICAAVKYEDGAIFRGHRHGDALRAAWMIGRARGIDNYHGGRPTVQGFITSRSRFVDRAEAYRLQKAAGIESIADGGYRGEELFSEDLY